MNHIDEIVDYIICEPSVDTDYKRGYKFPFLAAEILSLDSEIIQDYILSHETTYRQSKFPLLIVFILELSNYSDNFNTGENVSTIPGYIEKIVVSTFKQSQSKLANLIQSHFSNISDSLINNIDSEIIREIMFQILILPSEKTEVNKTYLELKITILGLVFGNIKKYSNKISEGSFVEDEKLKNSILLIIKLMKFMYKLKPEEINSLLMEIYSDENLNLIETIISDHNTMTDYNSSLQENEISTKFRYIFYLIYNTIATILKPPHRGVNCKLTSDIFKEEVLSEIDHISEKQHNKDEENTLNDSPAENSYDKANPNSFSLSSNEVKEKLTYFLIKNFSNIIETSQKIKFYFKLNKKIPTIANCHVIPASQEYLIFLDILISILQLKIVEEINTNLFEVLIDDLIFYYHNEFLLNKILKIFEVVLFDNYYLKIKQQIVLNDSLFQKLLKSLDIKSYINIETKVINNRNKFNYNYAHLIQLVNYFYVSIKELNESDFDTKYFPSLDDKITFENHLLLYLELTSKDLLSDKLQSLEDLKNLGDEEIKIEKNCIYFIKFRF